MKIIDIKVTAEKINFKNNTIRYTTETEAGPGILMLCDDTGTKGLLLTNQLHMGGEVVLDFKPFVIPTSKYKIGEVAAKLVLFE